LGSGSSGNASFVASSKARVLIDAGFSCKEIFRRLDQIGIKPTELDSVVITHEHSDHVRGLDVLIKRLNIPVYLSRGTWENLKNNMNNPVSHLHVFSAGKGFEIGDIGFESFSVLHDAADPVGFCLYNDGSKIGVATDLGKSTHLVRESLKGSQCLILESNHDPGMLYRGPYPWWLKQRIKGMFGHLSNEDSASLLTDLLHTDLKHVVLAHISQKNNMNDMVQLNAMKVLQKHDCRHIELQVALQDRAIRPIELV
jgi:phosphoribosyl 1,2-cyclic phosphodiesterase